MLEVFILTFHEALCYVIDSINLTGLYDVVTYCMVLIFWIKPQILGKEQLSQHFMNPYDSQWQQKMRCPFQNWVQTKGENYSVAVLFTTTFTQLNNAWNQCNKDGAPLLIFIHRFLPDVFNHGSTNAPSVWASKIWTLSTDIPGRHGMVHSDL